MIWVFSMLLYNIVVIINEIWNFRIHYQVCLFSVHPTVINDKSKPCLSHVSYHRDWFGDLVYRYPTSPVPRTSYLRSILANKQKV